GSVLRPVNRAVIHDILVICHLHQDLETDRLPGDPFCELVVEVVGTLAFCCSLIQILIAGVGCDPVTSIAAYAVPVREAHCCYAEVGLLRKAGRCRLRLLHESKRLRVAGEKGFNRGWRGLLRVARGDSPKELEKLLTGPGWESIGRMAHNIGM